MRPFGALARIHVHDMNRLFTRAVTDGRMSGAYVATAPHPVSNAEFMRELRKALGVPFGLPAKAWMVRLAAPVLRTDPELALFGRYCVSRRLREDGFEFAFPHVRDALRDLYGKGPNVRRRRSRSRASAIRRLSSSRSTRALAQTGSPSSCPSLKFLEGLVDHFAR